MDAPVLDQDSFFHVRVIIGIVVGLSVARLLTGLARFVQHPTRQSIYPVHLGWVAFLFLAVIHFWWFEFTLSHVSEWTFGLYFFVICYAALFFFVCAVLFPDSMAEYSGFADYFHSRQKWFYALLAGLFVVDVADTALKGAAHLRSLGPEYPIRQAVFFVLALVAMFVQSRLFHAAFVIFALVIQVIWILYRFDVLG